MRSIQQIDRDITENRRELRKSVPRFNLLDVASWQRVREANPLFVAREDALFRERGEACSARDRAAYEALMRQRRSETSKAAWRRRKCAQRGAAVA